MSRSSPPLRRQQSHGDCVAGCMVARTFARRPHTHSRTSGAWGCPPRGPRAHSRMVGFTHTHFRTRNSHDIHIHTSCVPRTNTHTHSHSCSHGGTRTHAYSHGWAVRSTHTHTHENSHEDIHIHTRIYFRTTHTHTHIHTRVRTGTHTHRLVRGSHEAGASRAANAVRRWRKPCDKCPMPRAEAPPASNVLCLGRSRSNVLCLGRSRSNDCIGFAQCWACYVCLARSMTID